MTPNFAPFSHLSQEVIDEIIDSLLDTRKSGRHISQFCACALVCRSFRHRSQKHIFHSIAVCGLKRITNCRERVDTLYGILQENPRIASFVRGLRFDIETTTGWVILDPLFLQIMESIARTWEVGMKLEIHIFGFSNNFQITDKRMFETQFITPFVTPFITSLKLQCVYNIPVSLLAHCPHLVELQLGWMTLEGARPLHVVDIDHSLRPHLRKFTYRSCGDTIPILAADLIDFSQLQYLSISGYLSEELNDAICILDASSSSLEHLQFDFEQSESLYSDVYDLSKIPNLAILSLALELDFDEESPLRDLCGLLRTIPSGKHEMKTIVFDILGRLQSPWDLTAYLDRIEWHSLNLVLAKIAEQAQLVATFKFNILLEEFDPDTGVAEEINDRVDREMKCWISQNLELVPQLSSNISLEYDYTLEFI